MNNIYESQTKIVADGFFPEGKASLNKRNEGKRNLY